MDLLFIILIPGAILFLGLIILFNVYLPAKRHKAISTTIINIAKGKYRDNFKLLTLKHDKYDYLLEVPSQMYAIKVINLQANYELVINNKTKWQVNRSMAVGKAASSSFMLNNIEDFMNADFKELGKKVVKVVIIYPTCYNIMKYINECEMIFVYPNIDVYGTKIIRLGELTEKFELL